MRDSLGDRGSHGEGRGLDVDVPAGEASGKTRVLAFLADSQGKLIVGNDHGSVVLILVDLDTR